MVCVADNIYHSIATYSWLSNDTLIPGEKYAVLYSNRPGMYRAVVLNALTKEKSSCSFEVKLRTSIIYQLFIIYAHCCHACEIVHTDH